MTTESITEDVVRIELSRPDDAPGPFSRPNNAYLLRGEFPGLVNVGHPAQFRELVDALRSLGVEPSDLERVIYTSWHVDSLGGATNFPGADHFVISPDMVKPRRYDELVEVERARLRGLGDEVLEREDGPDGWSRTFVEDFVETHLPPVSNGVDFIPIRGGHTVRCGRRTLEVISAPGTNRGGAVLWDAGDRLAFTGDLEFSGLPVAIDDVRSYLVAVERSMELDPDKVLPTYGAHRTRGRWTLQRGLRFANNFLSNAPAALTEAPTLTEFVATDRGEPPDDLVEYLYLLQTYRPFLDELVRSRMVEASGEGLDRRYGIDVEDPRAPLR